MSVEIDAGMARIRGEQVSIDHAVAELRVQPRLGRTPVRIELPGGGLLVAPAEAIAGILAIPRAAGLARKLESNLGVVAASLAGLLVAGWFIYRDGIPWAAREIAYRLPPDIERQLAEEGLQGMDRMVLQPSELTAERRAALAEIFAGLRKDAALPAEAALHFRAGGWLGANAMAIPGGAVVITDELVSTLGDDEQIAAVLAHELGHLRHRHGARQIIQASVVGLVAGAVFGDISSVASLAATIPTVLAHTSYTRDFEREADRYAYGLLKASGRSPRLLGDALAAMESRARRGAQDCRPEPDGTDKPGDDAKPKPSSRAHDLGYLSTHPATEERIRDAIAAAQ